MTKIDRNRFKVAENQRENLMKWPKIGFGDFAWKVGRKKKRNLKCNDFEKNCKLTLPQKESGKRSLAKK